MPFIWPTGVRSMFSHGDSEPLTFAPRPEFSQVPGDYAPFMAITAKGSLFDREVEKRVADVAERIVRALEEAAEKHPNPIVRLNLSDAADIARSHATPPVAATSDVTCSLTTARVPHPRHRWETDVPFGAFVHHCPGWLAATSEGADRG